MKVGPGHAGTMDANQRVMPTTGFAFLRRSGEDPKPARVPSRLAARHAGKVADVVAQLNTLRHAPRLSLQKKTVPHQVPKRHDQRREDAKVVVSALDEILLIDPVSRIC